MSAQRYVPSPFNVAKCMIYWLHVDLKGGCLAMVIAPAMFALFLDNFKLSRSANARQSTCIESKESEVQNEMEQRLCGDVDCKQSKVVPAASPVAGNEPVS